MVWGFRNQSGQDVYAVSSSREWQRIQLMFGRPFPMIIYPAAIYAFLCYSISLVLTVAVNILNPFVLQAPPYNWNVQINGLINIPGILGNVFGSWAGGKRT